MIEIRNLKKTFDHNVVALENFNLTIDDGQFIALLGPSGCGKSTTLNCLAGLLDPTKGTILIDGKDMTDAAPKDRNIGMVFQSYALYPHLSVLDNIAFPLKQKGVSKEERYKKAREVSKKLQIEHLLERKPAELSGGQQQRVAMCRAIVKGPRILLLDEPMSNLDARLKIEIREVIKDIQQDLRVTAILVTHDQEEAMALADKIAILDGGKIQQFDTPDVLYECPSNLFVANFMGNPPMNFFQAKMVDRTHFVIGETVLSCKMPLDAEVSGAEVRIGVRSHLMHIAFVQDEEFSLPMTVRIVENLGKELLVYGSVGKDEVRISYQDKTMYDQLKCLAKGKGVVYLSLGAKYNVFLMPEGRNIVIF
ncbi:MAG: ABC transporter ATP-binding protein [Sphaerochaetaceae bacterium]|jgi:ABC-type sugar transport system ATPase subunit